MGPIHKIMLPKWGLSMKEARIIGWLKEVGAPIAAGDELVEIESEKIAGTVEAPGSGLLRRRLVEADAVAPVGSLLGIVAEASVPDAEIAAVVSEYLANFSTAAVATAASDPEPTKIVVGSRRLRYLVRGEGEDAAILIHGFGGDLNAWLFNHTALADRRRVYVLDLPGHGESTKDVGTGAIDELAQSVEEFMDALGIASAHVAGHSLGGAIAIALATREPTRVRSLALLASAGLGPEVDAGYVEGFISATTRNALKPHAAKLFANSALVTRRMIDDLLKYKRLEGVEACLRLISDRFLSAGQQAAVMRDALSRLRQPALVVWGSDDQIIPARHAAGLPTSVKAEVIPGKGHMIMMEAAGEVNRLLDELWS